MRTTIRLPDDLYSQVRVTAATTGSTVTSFIEQALRSALRGQSEIHEPYRVVPFQGRGLLPGVDLDDNSALMEMMDADLLDSDARA